VFEATHLWFKLIVAYLIFSFFFFSVFTGYVVLLRSLVPKFPLTLRGLEISFHPLRQIARTLMTDMKSKVSGPLPYKLVSSSTQFRALVPGRRKAIEVSYMTFVCGHSL
jgi:hypothetical protein